MRAVPSAPDDLDLALELADVADAITMARFRAADLVVETKPDLTPVSEADRAVEQAMREHLATRRPDDTVFGEEYGGAEPPGAEQRVRRGKWGGGTRWGRGGPPGRGWWPSPGPPPWGGAGGRPAA